MGAAIIVEVFPFSQFLVQIHVIGEAQELVKFILVGAVGSFHLAIQSGCPGPDVHAAHAQVLHVPMKLGLELATVVHPETD